MTDLLSSACATVDAEVQARADELEQLVFDLVACDSQIPPYGDERGVAELLTTKLAELDLPAPVVHALDPARPNLVCTVPAIPGAVGRRLALCGHIDTKPVGAAAPQWRSDPFVPTVRGDQVFGLGISDMKTSVAAMIMAVAAVRARGVQLRSDVVLALVADEEAGALYGSRYLAPRLAGTVDAVLIGEPSGWTRDWEGIHLVSRGLCCFTVTVSGTQMHSSLSDRMPSVNANLEMARLILALRSDLARSEMFQARNGLAPTANIAVMIGGGVFYGVVPGDAWFGCDLRVVPGLAEAEIHEFLEGWAAQMTAAGPATVTVRFDETLAWIPSASLPQTHPLVSATVSATRDVLGAAPALSTFPGTTDAPWWELAGVPALPSCGPGILTYCHGPNEFVNRPAILQAARIYARVILEYCGVAR